MNKKRRRQKAAARAAAQQKPAAGAPGADAQQARGPRWYVLAAVGIALAGGAWFASQFFSPRHADLSDLPPAFNAPLDDERFFSQAAPPVAASSTAQLADRLGRSIADFALVDQQGATVSLGDVSHELAVVVFLSCDCPLAQRYVPTLVELSQRYTELGVGWLAVVPGRRDTQQEIAEFAASYGVDFPLLLDEDLEVCRQFSAERTPEVYVLDRERIVRYVGRIDDQFGLHEGMKYQRTDSRSDDLAAALDELLAGNAVSVPLTPTAGCLIHYPPPTADAPKDITWSNRIAHIVQARCQGCHRPGQIGPFPLLDYADVAGWESAIREVVRERRMPPWHADPRFGHFSNDPSLSADEIAAITSWVEQGAPEGDPADLPTPRQWPEHGNIRSPDRVIHVADEPLVIPADGAPDFKYFIVDLGLSEGVWVSQVECQPDNLAVVHHMDLLVAAAGDFDEAYRRGQVMRISGYVPGIQLNDAAAEAGVSNEPMHFIPAGSQIMIEMHYRPNGREELDRSSVAFRFARGADGKLVGAEGQPIDPAGIVDADLQRQVSPDAPHAPLTRRLLDAVAHQQLGIEYPPGYRYAQQEVDSLDLRGRETASVLIENYDFCVPPHANRHRVVAWYTFAHDSLLGSMHAHMHTRGQSMRYIAHYPIGLKEVLLNISRYDYEWQHVYTLQRMKWMPRGTRIEVVSHFDNSAQNLRNPDPEATVVYGRGYYEEEMTAATITFMPLTSGAGSVTLEQLRDGWDVAKNVDPAEALARYTPVKRVAPEHIATYYHQRAQYRQHIGDMTGAMEDFHQAIERESERTAAYLDRGRLYEVLGERELARADFEYAAQLEPWRAEIQVMLGTIHTAPEQALAAFERAIELDPRNHEAYYYRGVTREALGDAQGAIDDYSMVIQHLHPGYARAYLNRGGLLIAGGQTALGQADLDTVVRRWPTQQTKVDYMLGMFYFDRREFAQAIPHLEAVARISPKEARIRKSLGIALLETNQSGAAEHLAVAVDLKAGDVAAQLALAMAQERDGKFTLALARYRHALRLAPDHPMVLNNLAWLLATLAHENAATAAEAVRLARRACELTDQQEPGCLDTLAAALAAAQQWAEAVETARRAIEGFEALEQDDLAEQARQRLHVYQQALADSSSETEMAR